MQNIKFNRDLNVLNNAQKIMQNHQIIMFAVKNVIIISIQKQEINVLKVVQMLVKLTFILFYLKEMKDINVLTFVNNIHM